MKKSLLLTFGAIAVFSLVSCGTPPEDLFSSSGATSQSETEMQSIYRLYRKNGGNLTYEEWIESIRGEKGEKGDPGKDGANFLSGVGAPELALGKDGDTYLDIQALAFYKKSNGVWQRMYVPSSSSSQSSQYTSSSSQYSSSQLYPSYPYPEYVAPTIPAGLEQKDVSIKLWCASEIKALTEVQVNRFKNALTDWTKSINVTFEAMGEYDAASEMIKDVDAGADIYFFAQDQLPRLAMSRAINEVPTNKIANIRSSNIASAVSAATLDGQIYAYPATADNGYYLYYDGSKFTAEEAADWEKLIAKAESSKVEIDYEYTSAWYNFGFFYGAGCDSIWETNAEGKFVGYNDTFNSGKGMDAIRALAKVVKSSAVVSNSSIGKVGETCAALVSGTWDYKYALQRWGSNLKCAELPYFTTKDGRRVHTGSFSGNKLLGVKPQTDATKKWIADELAAYLAGEICQAQRFEANAWWGPSNSKVINSDMAKAAPQITALLAQNKYAKPQGLFPGEWWDAAGKNFGYPIKAEANVDDTFLQGLLTTYEASLEEMINIR